MNSNIKYSLLKVRRLKQLVFVFTFLGLNIFYLSAHSQNETQINTTTNQTDRIIQYLTPLEYAFMMHEETSWLFKMSYSQLSSDFYSFGASIEKRIAPNFTLNYKFDVKVTLNHDELKYNNITNALEARWYYRMNKRIKENKGAKNMSGNYLAVGIDAYSSTTFHFYMATLYAKWGLQRRFLKNGLIDFGLKAGVVNTLISENQQFFIFNTFTDIGFAFTKDKYKLDHEKLCPVLKCYDADNFVIKSDLVSLLHIFLDNDISQIVISPNIAIERKIGKSAFSINTELDLLFRRFHQNINQQVYKYVDYEMSLMLEGRWYYNLKNRMLKGKTGNSLSANYIALGGSYTISQVDNYDSPISKLSYPTIHLSTGIQRLISKHLYYDFNIGVGYIFDQKNRPDGLIMPFNIAIGYRF